jgi:hypothetical protein
MLRENGAALATYAHSAGLMQFGGIEWRCSLRPEARLAILTDLYARAMPQEVEVELSAHDRQNIALRKEGVLGVPIPQRTRPATDPQCQQLREMLQEEGMSKDEFLALAQEDDFDNMPMILTMYLALYFDIGKGKFSVEAFERQYNKGEGIA